jgi:hypothetical protein
VICKEEIGKVGKREDEKERQIRKRKKAKIKKGERKSGTNKGRQIKISMKWKRKKKIN